MPGSTSRGYPYPVEADAPPDVAADMQSLAEAVNADVAGVAADVVPLDVVGTNITTSHPGDAKEAGTSGEAADAGHRHEREDAPPVNFAIPFHIANTVTTGLKVPKWIATAACTLRGARAVVNAGSGVTYRVYVNGAAPTGMTTSGAVGTSSSLHDFNDVTVAVGDVVQVNVIGAGTSASDLSITVDGIWT